MHMTYRIIKENNIMNMQEATSIMKADSYKMAALSEDTRNNILVHVKDALIAHKDEIFAANAKDMAAAEENGIAASVKKRLKFDEHKLADVTNGIDELIKLPDPVGQIQLKRELDEGLPADEGEGLFWQKFGFAPEDGRLVRRRTPDLTAVRFVQDYLAAHLPHPKLCIDATCGNGGDTAFLCRLVGPEGRVLGFDIQPEAITSTRTRLEKQGLTAELICDSHANLLQYVWPGTADIVMFNFGWLPGADHSVFSTADSSIPALEAALAALRTGGVLSAILYSGRVIGTDEKQSILGWLRALPLEKYTVLVCDFANWADTAPLPCLILKK